ncbi:hypothetical protein [Hoeflea prorocentri]|uniref:Uncharacterized protein n=1 Tax=Hoeflea prorocentri TaxID=1922333 RepID=A0A9X3UEK8_9HYPH|nr:hypothetical protein [Hoeflea prorocentri]MCY6379223.1 hypothetical protein [Hoeflea prorocentri]MDA5397024.1 hypothetical protein [Hoeflea prorocentri]
MTYRTIAAAFFLSPAVPALAHPGAHTELTAAGWLAHMVASPFHMAVVAAAMAVLGGFVLFRRLTAKNRTRK